MVEEFEPKQFGKYLLLEKIAMGGMAEIYKAKTYGVDGFEKELAIKRILPHCSADKDFVSMLVDEAKLSVLLSHANIVQVYDLGKVHDDYYISMEFIHGVNLRDIMYRCRETKRPVPTDIAVYIASEICKGLDYAHRKTDQHNHPLNIVHRDVSPQNILISYEGEVKVGDFGIAKAAMNISHTIAGILKGKIAYMSPEQAMGKAVDWRTDIFSTGILLYEMVTGTKLFTGESQFEVLKKIRTTRISADELPDSVPEELKPILAQTLAHEVEDRIQHAGDLQIELTKYLYSTYVDFTPRKLASLIKEIFADELKEEQEVHAREEALEQITASMDIMEGARQMDIVHREVSFPPREITAKEAKAAEISVTPEVAPEAPTISRTIRRITWQWTKVIALATFIAAGAFALYRYVPQVRFWEEPPPRPKILLGSANITSDPSGAKIIIDGKDTGQVTPDLIGHLSVGRTYTIRVEKKGLVPEEKAVNIASTKRMEVKLALAKHTGVLNIITEPAGAAIMLQGRLTGLTTPATLESLPLRKDLHITLSKPDFEDFEQVVNLTSEKPQKISTRLKPVAPQKGKLVITSTPPGASVILDGKDTARTTPATIANLDPKKYTIALRMSGYEDWKKDFDVTVEKPIPVDAALKKKVEEKPPEKPAVAKKGSLRITSRPSGARIFLDGRSTGKRTPTTLKDLEIGATYRIQLSKDGYKKAYRKKTMAKESERLYSKLTKEVTEPAPPPPPAVREPKPQLPPTVVPGKPGRIKLASRPSRADVFINAEHKGRTPLTVAVPPGSVQVLVNKEGRVRYSKRITVNPGQTVNLTNIKLADLYGQVSLSTTPPKAQVIFDGQTIPAKTPVTVRRVRRDRQHTVVVRLKGYRPWTRTFSMEGKDKSFNVVLQPE